MKKLATVQERFLAKLIDWALQAFPLITLFSSIELISDGGNTRMHFIMPAIASITLLCVVFILMQWTLIAAKGQSIGKIIMRIKIVEEHGKKVPSAWNVLFLRTLINSLILGNGIYFLLDALMILKKERRCIHDFIAGTIVIKTK